MCCQLGSIISANIYRDDDKPLYKRGNRVLIGINAMVIVLFLLTKVYYVTKNKIRDRKWNAMSPEVYILVALTPLSRQLTLITGKIRLHAEYY